jgi:hypothetical protein
MANARGSVVAVDLSSNFANLAAVNTALAAGIAALASGFVPERIHGENVKIGSSFKTVIWMDCHKTPYQDWITVANPVLIAYDISGNASVAALNTAIATAVDSIESANTKTVRGSIVLTVRIAGVLKKVLILLATSGTPAIS